MLNVMQVLQRKFSEDSSAWDIIWEVGRKSSGQSWIFMDGQDIGYVPKEPFKAEGIANVMVVFSIDYPKDRGRPAENYFGITFNILGEARL